jgi:hypothetical protein
MIKFDRQTHFLGRNGMFKCSGLFTQKDDIKGKITISPITSKMKLGRNFIQIPEENIKDLIKQLENYI